MKKKVPILILLLSIFYFCIGGAAQMETLPVGDRIYEWVYDFIDQLYLRGYFEDLHFGTKPYFRGEVAQSLSGLKKRIEENEVHPSGSELWMIHKLEEEFAYEMEIIDAKDRNVKFSSTKAKLKWGVDFLESMQFKSKKKSNFLESGLPYLGAGVKDDFSLFVRYNLDESLTSDSLYTGKVWQGMAGDVAQAYLGFKLPWFSLLMGRDKLFWGQSKISSLILSDQILPFDLFKIQGEWKSFKATFFTAFLDPLQLEDSLGQREINRYLSGHRLSINLLKILGLGLSETVVYGGENRGLEPYYLNPLIWFHGAQLNQNKDDNTFLSFDFNLRPQRNLMLYGEFLIDDYQIEDNSPQDNEPDELAYAVGFSMADFLNLNGCQINLEYQRVNNRTYNQKFLWNRYLYKNRVLGSSLGPDSDCFEGRFKGWIKKGLELEIGYSITRKGEGSVFSLWDEPWLNVNGDYKEKFPSGVVEKIKKINTNLEYFYNHALRVKFCATYAFISNRNHIPDGDEDEFAIDLLIQYHFLNR
jgi:hypothetical protein